MKIQQTKKPETRTQTDFLFEEPTFSIKPARKIGLKSSKKSTFLDKLWPKLVKISHFLGQRWDHQSPYHLSILDQVNCSVRWIWQSEFVPTLAQWVSHLGLSEMSFDISFGSWDVHRRNKYKSSETFVSWRQQCDSQQVLKIRATC